MDDERLYSFAIPPPGDDTPSAPVELTGIKHVHPSRAHLSAVAPSTASNKRKHGTATATKGPAATRAAHSKKREAPTTAAHEDDDGGEAAAPDALPPLADDEEKPLSHKEKRLAKKRKLAAEAAGLDPDAPAPAPAAAATTSSGSTATTIGTTLVGNTPGRSAHGIWVGNMNYATHPRELLAWFAGHGLKEVVRINMPSGKRSHENNRGFAYLDFPTAEDQQAAVALSEQHLDGRKLLIKASSDYSGRPAPAPAAGAGAGGAVKDVLASLDPSALERPDPRAAAHAAEGAAAAGSTATATIDSAAPPTLNRTARKILSRQKNPAGPTLFLGNLGFETTVDDIRDMFDRNQRRSSEWAPKGKGEKKDRKGKKGDKKGKGKGKGKEGESGDEDEDEEDADTDRDDDDSSSDSSEEEDSSDEEDESEGEENGHEKKKGPRGDKKAKGPKDLAKAKDAGIRKIRLGTFEDTGKCKGWAFVDFHLAAQATRALLNLHNHQLNGRKLNVEYASAEAVRRGQLGSRAVSKAHGRQRREAPAEGADEGYGDRAGGGGGAGRKRAEREWDDGDVRSFAAEAVADAAANGNGRPERQRREKMPRGGDGAERRGREPQPLPGGKRAKPGAALAMAQRASEAIVPGQGKKVTFD